jgi:NAD(P)-dependent dehydrogenase (short-subunit alcohol dehydrogenase family)
MSSDRVVVVTGGARGIGAAISCRFADDGATVVAVDLQEPATEDPRVQYEQADISVADDVNRLFSHIVSVHGRVDTLVNNAGIWFRRPFADISVEEWDQVFGVNVRGVFLCTQAVLGSMRAIGGGTIINIGSQAGLTVTRGQGAHYHAS